MGEGLETRELDESLRKSTPIRGLIVAHLDRPLTWVRTAPIPEGRAVVSVPVEIWKVRLSVVKSPEPGEIWVVEARFLSSGPGQPRGGKQKLEESAQGCPGAGTLCP